jgi:hypothetical protein
LNPTLHEHAVYAYAERFYRSFVPQERTTSWRRRRIKRKRKSKKRRRE